MAFPTIPAKATSKKKHHFVLKKSTTVLGQIRSFTIDETINVTEESRISDTTRFRERDDKTSNLNMVVYLQDSLKELAALFGNTLNPATGWAGTESIKLDPDSTAADYTIEMYNNVSGSAVLQGTWTVDNWQPTSLNIPVGDNQGSVVATVNGVCEALYYTPAAGIGST